MDTPLLAKAFLLSEREEAKTYLAELINLLQGIKSTELCAREDVVLPLINFEVPPLLEELVEERRITEIEFVLPQLSYRIKSFYLPKGSEVRICGAGVNLNLQ